MTSESLSSWRLALDAKKTNQVPRSGFSQDSSHIPGSHRFGQTSDVEIAARLYRQDHSHPFTNKGNDSGKSNRR